MVKAYLRYIQENVFGALTSNQANAIICKMLLLNLSSKAINVLATACNEVVSLSNLQTGEVLFKLYEEEAGHGFVTCLAASSLLLAVGYSSGHVIVYNLESKQVSPVHKGEPFEIEHTFNFHKTSVTALNFSDEDT